MIKKTRWRKCQWEGDIDLEGLFHQAYWEDICSRGQPHCESKQLSNRPGDREALPLCFRAHACRGSLTRGMLRMVGPRSATSPFLGVTGSGIQFSLRRFFSYPDDAAGTQESALALSLNSKGSSGEQNHRSYEIFVWDELVILFVKAPRK